MFMYSGSDPTYRDEVLEKRYVRRPKTFPKKAEVEQIAKALGSTVFVAVAIGAWGICAGTGLVVDGGASAQEPRYSSMPPPAKAGPPVSEAAAMEWPRPCERAFEEMSERAPGRLHAWIASGLLSEAHLSFAAESLGRAKERFPEAKEILLNLLKHPSPIVREGAVLGLAHTEDSGVFAILEEVAAAESSPGVRRAIGDVLEG